MKSEDSTNSEKTLEKNKSQYDALYSSTSGAKMVKVLQRFEAFLDDTTQTDTSWKGFYLNDFRKQLKGKRVLEMGCGDCLNAAIMTMLGAEVVANDISDEPGRIIAELNASGVLPKPITYVFGDFLQYDTKEEASFDFVVGKAFLHHLTLDLERQFLEKTARLLKPGGQARFFEPAINSLWLDKLRFMIPVSGRPSSLQRKAFKAWEEADPHPERPNSSEHYRNSGLQYFSKVDIYCIGAIQKFHRLLPSGSFDRKFRRFAFRLERYLPKYLNDTFARSQLIVLTKAS
ncbi:class I SAM-dependent methyltransferase [Flavobacterium sp.]|uniref:class I SAM-dependent methyltransferase n=1 Tax=Flavobacterium sp. TaxID=239 RepID=UPI003B9B969B